MRIIFYSLLVSLISLGSLSAQTFVRKVNTVPNGNRNAVLNTNELNILAVLVEFQDDRDDGTSGNGKFGTGYSKDYGFDIIDPLPHNKEFFEDHLLFAKNYFSKVSGGKLEISYKVLPNILTVSKRIREYSPDPGTSDYSGLGEFSKEVWELADAENSDVNFNDYDLFVIFHAGVGNDISVPGSIGGERDLPSVYLGEKSLKNIYGQSFEGFSVDNGNFMITNTLLLPETESREMSGIGGTTLLELSINGLTVANIASHLGLPDLFDTNTGKSAIGRFGLMDGQAIFAYSGLFPPEPSPWEKIYLGWETPITLNVFSGLVNIKTKLISGTEPYIYKIPINATEYYLVENRQRDALKDGINIQYKVNGELKEFSLPKDTTGFYSFEVDTLSGVILDVDEFDWAVPGNGILVWHIDESIIADNIEVNKINVDIDNRGVDLEEADGIQDIGEEFQTIFGTTAVGEGEEFDFWYKENDSELYKNSFTNDTRPNTKSNSGAASLISMTDFSEIANTMSFNLSYESDKIELIANRMIDISNNGSEHPSDLSLTSDNKAILIGYGRSVYKTDIIIESTIHQQILDFSNEKTVSYSIDGKKFIVGTIDDKLSAIITENNIDTRETIALDSKIVSAPVLLKDEGKILVGAENGKIYETDLNFQSQLVETNSFNGEIISLTANNSILTSSSWYIENNLIFSVHEPKQIASSNNGFNTVLFDNKIVLNANGNLVETEIDSSVNSFSLADLKNDNSYYAVYCEGNKVHAINEQGISADNFPYSEINGYNFVGQPLSVDLDGDNKSDIIASTENGMIYAISGNDGEVLEGFPISAGEMLATTPVVFNYDGRASLAVITNSNQLMVWHISDTEGEIFWGQKYADQYNSSVAPSVKSTETISEFFPKDKAYNWPNPVYSGETNIRYYVSEDSDITIKIFDLVGDYVAELSDKAIGGFDNETVWNVADIQSGVYFAHLEVKGNNGNSGSKIIKIAVIK
ncbi:MAG: T9SS type A sorting domain-containing protein [Melioribacteraceae bacterium]|nr:T9SS type A sorting domain-containing protein [Melioribacteraceae bacterium]